jgi:hypothetical protein
MTKSMTRQQEYEFYAEPDNQAPLGPPRRRGRLTEMVPVRFPPEMLEAVRRRAEGEDRSVSNWIRRAVERELASVPGETSGKTSAGRSSGTRSDQRSRKPTATTTKAASTGRASTPKARS